MVNWHRVERFWETEFAFEIYVVPSLKNAFSALFIVGFNQLTICRGSFFSIRYRLNSFLGGIFEIF
jgi:hypothetical protein